MSLVGLVAKIEELEQEIVDTRNELTGQAIKCADCERAGVFPWHYVDDYKVTQEEREFDININDVTSGSLVKKNVDAEKLLVNVRTCPNGHEVFNVVNTYGENGPDFRPGEKPEFNII